MKRKIEYYILAGDKGLKDLLIKHGINTDSIHLLIVSEYSQIGKLVRKTIKKNLFGK